MKPAKQQNKLPDLFCFNEVVPSTKKKRKKEKKKTIILEHKTNKCLGQCMTKKN